MDYRDHYYRDALEFEKKRQTWKKSFVKTFLSVFIDGKSLFVLKKLNMSNLAD